LIQAQKGLVKCLHAILAESFGNVIINQLCLIRIFDTGFNGTLSFIFGNGPVDLIFTAGVATISVLASKATEIEVEETQSFRSEEPLKIKIKHVNILDTATE